MFWIINDNIKFSPENNQLVSLTKPELNVILTTPASRCLILLLESSPGVVSQKDFFKKVWAEEGMIVPVNTLYQNISIIRRGLRTAGETSESLVATVPRKGFQIDSNVKVTRVMTEEILAENPEDNATPEEDEEAQHVAQETPAADTPLTQTVQKKRTLPLYRRYILLLSMLISFGLGVLLFQYPWFQHSEKDFFKTYNINRTENGCHFVSKNEDISSRGNFTKFKDMILQTGLDCKRYPWVYFPSSSSTPVLSALACHEPYEKQNNSGCVTLYFRGVTSD